MTAMTCKNAKAETGAKKAAGSSRAVRMILSGAVLLAASVLFCIHLSLVGIVVLLALLGVLLVIMNLQPNRVSTDFSFS